ncbi:MAG: nicotinate-nucleotide--dimethylbenzimidazole phosphoribosyltransferase [Bacteroidota bacterium]|nr:nicotinate-nucleotide--dimethylbenzimidazole phosphoribosyltransferase [Bacteroidota bacterium]
MSLLQDTIDAVRPLDEKVMNEAQQTLDYLMKPQGSLGKLEDIARQVAGITGKVKNTFRKKAVLIMSSDNGVTEEGIAGSPRDFTMLVTDIMLRGKSGACTLAKHAGGETFVVDLGMEKDPPSPGLINRKIRRMTSNFLHEPAMTREEAIHAIEIGIEETCKLIDKGYDLIGTGEMGIGNTTTSSAMLHVFTGEPLDVVVGRGAGLDDKGLQRKKEVIRQAIALHKPNPADPIDVLSKVGGFDIAGMAGTYLACAARRMPVMIDGFISGVAALLAIKLCPEARNYMFASHGSAEPGAQIIARELNLSPFLTMDMRLGEGSGCALAFHVMDAAMYMMNHQGTFEDLGAPPAISNLHNS